MASSSSSIDSAAREDVVIDIKAQETELVSHSQPKPDENPTPPTEQHAKLTEEICSGSNNGKKSGFATEVEVGDSPELSPIADSENIRHDENPTPSTDEHGKSSGVVGSAEIQSLGSGEQDDVAVGSSKSTLRKRFNLRMTKPKSRLICPGESELKLMKSGVVAEIGSEKNLFVDDDLPADYKAMKISPLSTIQMLSVILIVGGLICTLVIRELRRFNILDIKLWKWGIMILVLVCGKLISYWGIIIVVSLIKKNFIMRKRVGYHVYCLRSSIGNVCWLGLVLVTWECIYYERLERLSDGKVLHFISRILIWLVAGYLIWILKTLLLKVLIMSFLVRTYLERIQELLFREYVVEKLSGLPNQQDQEEEEMTVTPQTLWKSPVAINPNPMFYVYHLHRLSKKNVSALNMKRLITIVRKGVLSGGEGQDETSVRIKSEKQAKDAAKKIFNNVAKQESEFIFQEDLMQFLREDAALKTICLLDGAEEKGVSTQTFENYVVNVFRERRNLSLSLDDIKAAVKKLRRMLDVVVAVSILAFALLILRVVTLHLLIILSSQLMLFVFIFGNTCKTAFEGIMFLFVSHLYDIGDRVSIDGEQMVVEEMHILKTVFLKVDNLNERTMLNHVQCCPLSLISYLSI